MKCSRNAEPESEEGMAICLNCPLDKCEMEERTREVYNRRVQVSNLLKDGIKQVEICKRLGMSRKTLWSDKRWFREHKMDI